jgi:hypothetical protein
VNLDLSCVMHYGLSFVGVLMYTFRSSVCDSSDLPSFDPATLNEMILYYRLMTKWSGLGDSTELSRMGLSQRAGTGVQHHRQRTGSAMSLTDEDGVVQHCRWLKFISSSCTSKHGTNWTATKDSNRQCNGHPNNIIVTVYHFDTMADLVLRLIQYQASECIHPNEALRLFDCSLWLLKSFTIQKV